MAALGAIKGGQDRPDRDGAPYRNSSVGIGGSIGAADKQRLQQLSGHAPQTPPSSDGPTQHATPPPTAVSAASSSPAAARKTQTQRLSRGPSAATAAEGTPPAQQGQPAASAASVPSSSASANASSIDPLSQHIFLRTNTDPARNPKHPLRPHPPGADSPAVDAAPAADASARFASLGADGREKKKGFLGRLSMRAARKKEDADHASEAGEPRDEGSDAHVFSSIVDSAGFIPHHKAPPRYIRVKAHNKKTKEFDRMFLAQELIGTRPLDGGGAAGRVPVVTVSGAGQGRKKTATGGAVWATAFSKDGRYLAAGGRDHVVRVWQVICTPEDRRRQEEEEEAQNEGGADERLSAPVFLEKPVQEFTGHTGEILDLSWSKNNFLLSTSMDKTVRLWHTSRSECLCTFKHKELVSKVAFHPRDDRFFLAGSLDATLRLWSIPDKTVAFAAQLADMITAVAFSPDGKMAIAGLLSGFCCLLETDGLRPLTQIHVRSSRGRNAKGSKITGIVPMVLPGARPGDAAILITSTDARVRLYSLRDKTLDCKFKGHEHASGQLAASFSDDGKYVISGSEARKVFIWSTASADAITKDRYPCETFDAHGDMVTTALFAPVQTRQLLGASGDPIYDLCNPPPITLMSLEETLASQAGLSSNTLGHDDAPAQAAQQTPPQPRPEASPAYIARSTHYDGNIIVTSDDTGIIKVFRQDCAAKKRRHESWETGSSFGPRGSMSMTNARIVGRSGSIITRTSASSAAHSRRGSLSLPPAHLVAPQMGGTSDSINRWRHGIEGNGIGGGSGSAPAAQKERSISPSKASRVPLPLPGGLASDARKQPYAATTSSPLSPHFAPGGQAGAGSRSSMLVSPTSTTFAGASTRKPALGTPAAPAAQAAQAAPATAPAGPAATPSVGTASRPSDESASAVPASAAKTDDGERGGDERGGDENAWQAPATPTSPPATMAFRSAADEDTLRLDAAGASYGFWNLNRWKGIAGLRTSLIGGSGSSSSHHDAASGGADDKSDGEGAGAGRPPHHARHSHHGSVLHKAAPLPASETGDATAATTTTTTPARQKSAGRLSLLSPATTADDDHQFLTPLSASHSPYATRQGSIVSRLSSEMTSTDGEHGDDGDGDGVEMRCPKCGGREFKARRAGGVQRLHCSRCGKVLEEKR